MIAFHRLCLGCLSCWTGSEDAFCESCTLEHERAVARSGNTYGKRNDTETDWWGPVLSGVDPSEISDGFHVIEIEYRDEHS